MKVAVYVMDVANGGMDDRFARLLTFPNMLITGHQGFFTVEALTNIAATTIANLDSFEQSGRPVHEVAIDAPAAAPAVPPIPAELLVSQRGERDP